MHFIQLEGKYMDYEKKRFSLQYTDQIGLHIKYDQVSKPALNFRCSIYEISHSNRSFGAYENAGWIKPAILFRFMHCKWLQPLQVIDNPLCLRGSREASPTI